MLSRWKAGHIVEPCPKRNLRPEIDAGASKSWRHKLRQVRRLRPSNLPSGWRCCWISPEGNLTLLTVPRGFWRRCWARGAGVRSPC